MRALMAIPLFFFVAAILLVLASIGLFLQWLSRLDEPADDYRKWPETGRAI
jgi:hypothetical protein